MKVKEKVKISNTHQWIWREMKIKLKVSETWGTVKPYCQCILVYSLVLRTPEISKPLIKAHRPKFSAGVVARWRWPLGITWRNHEDENQEEKESHDQGWKKAEEGGERRVWVCREGRMIVVSARNAEMRWDRERQRES